MTAYVLTVHCISRRGIVAAISGCLAASGCNITDAAQFNDRTSGRFFARLTFIAETRVPVDAIRRAFAAIAEPFGMQRIIREVADRMKVFLMVSNFGHCLSDLLYR